METRREPTLNAEVTQLLFELGKLLFRAYETGLTATLCCWFDRRSKHAIWAQRHGGQSSCMVAKRPGAVRRVY